MILKSFYKKKSTKIYLIIFSLIFTIFGVVLIGKNYYTEKYNQNYSDAFLYVEAEGEMSFADIDGVSEVKEAIKNGIFVFTYSDVLELKDDEVSIPDIWGDSYTTIDFETESGEVISFSVSSYYESDAVTPIVYVNKNTLDILLDASQYHSYMLKLDNWDQHERIANEIFDLYNVEPIAYMTSNSDIDYSSIVKNFSTYTYIVIGIFILVSIFTVYNIIIDEKKKNYIYRSLGYTKSSVIRIQLINIVSIFCISLMISGLLLVFIKNIMFR